MHSRKSLPEEAAKEQQKHEEERQKEFVVQVVKLPNGATFTRLKPVTA